jgi:iron(III) transport system ATP-binding protein
VSALVSVSGLVKTFGGSRAVDGVSFDVEEGQLLVLLGPSGCGKTTTLRCIGGLEHPDEGSIAVDGVEVTNCAKGRYLQPEERGMGMVAQSYAIWPHMSVAENVAFPLRMRREPNASIARRVDEALEVVRLKGMGERNATALSGGQQQRVALARAIVARPKVILFDEPLSNLDAKLREQMRYLIRDIQREIRVTAVYVTHDQAEAMGLGDELIVMNSGRIEQRGGPRSLYCEPASRFVAEFIGVANLLHGTVLSSGGDDATVLVKVGNGKDTLDIRCLRGSAGDIREACVLARPEWIGISRDKPEGRENVFAGKVVSSQYLGERTELLVDTALGELRITASDAEPLQPGDEVYLLLNAGRCIALPCGDSRP